MTLLLKAPGALLDYSVDWGTHYLLGDVLTQSEWSVSPDEPGGVQVAASTCDGLIATVQVSGGEAGKVYRLVNHVTTAAGLQDSRSITLRVEAR